MRNSGGPEMLDADLYKLSDGVEHRFCAHFKGILRVNLPRDFASEDRFSTATAKRFSLALILQKAGGRLERELLDGVSTREQLFSVYSIELFTGLGC